MAENILDSYFVKVAALPDASSFLKLRNTLTDVELSIGSLTTKGLVSMAKFEAASLGIFSAIGVGLVSMADKTAMTDQSYRLMGLRFLMTKSSARSMQIALDELGATMDQVAYDPELNKRFQYLYEYNQKLGETLGKNFDRNMRSIRDLRMEYKMFGTELEFLVGGVMSNLFDRLGLSSNGVMDKMQNLNDWFATNLPTISEQITTKLVVPWQDSKTVISDSGKMLNQFGGDFTYLTGILAGDKSIQSTTFDVRKLGDAFTDILDIIAGATLNIQLFGKTGGHAIMGLVAGIKGYWESLHGDYKGANKDFDTFTQEEGQASSNVVDYFRMRFGKSPEKWTKNLDMSGWSEFAQNLTTRPSVYGIDQHGKNIYSPGYTAPSSGSYNQTSPQDLALLVDRYGKQYDLNPELLAAVIHQESHGNAGAISSKGAEGLMQMMPGTSKQYGVKNPFNAEQSIKGGAHYLADLLKKYHGDLSLALAAYDSGPGNVEKYHGIPPFKETQDYVSRILKEFTHLYNASQAAGGQVVIDNVTINVPRTLPDDQWHRFVHDSMSDMLVKNTRNTTAQTAGGAFF